MVVFRRMELFPRGGMETVTVGSLSPSVRITDDASPTKKATVESREKGTIQIVQRSDEFYQLEVSSPQPGFLFFADAPYPGWKAKIDQKEVPLYAAQLMGKAVKLPAGTVKVEFRFEPVSVTWGWRISLISLMILIGIC